MSSLLLDMHACAARMVELISSSRSTIYYSSFVCQLNVSLPGQPEGTTMSRLLHDATARGVKIRMFFNPSEQYGNSLEELGDMAGVEVCLVKSDGYIPVPFDTVFGERYTNHHQKFLLVDDATIMVGGVGVHPCRAGWLELNTEEPDPYYWHEVGVVMPCPPEMARWVHAMWEGVYGPPPFPFVAGEEEHQATLRLIREAKSCIHMEAQLCISTNRTHNRVLDTVVDRVVRAYHTPGDSFCFMMLVNTHQPDEHVVVSAMTTATLHWSRRMMMANAAAQGVPDAFMRERVFIGTLEHNGTHIKVHTNLIIQDGHTMLRTSSNLTDRSLSPHPCDNELGVVVHGPEVAAAQQELWSRYFMQPTTTWWPRSAFRLMVRETGLVRAVRYHKVHDTAFLPDVVVDFFMGAIHSLPYFGGKTPVTWSSDTL
jgi:phosphatidylserine/phosphatidylglycerophosphate/cardiolipin synthase-like enzyme